MINFLLRMHFIHPEYLYGLFLLIIPVLVHLFQLRRFKKERFTNVKFLKKAVLKTRKSSQIKKWLILTLRCLILACLVLAFAQPYFPASEENIQIQETVIYLDNSYSMQAKGPGGVLLKRSVQELLEAIPEEGKLTLFTNNSEFRDVDRASLRKELPDLDFSAWQLDWQAVSLKADNLFSEREGILKNLILISDFQNRESAEGIENEGEVSLHLVKLNPVNRTNISIDTAYITENTLDETELSVGLSTSDGSGQEVSLSIYDGSRLLAKRSLKFEDEQSLQTVFSLPSGAIEKGRIEISDPGLEFDNNLYFSINKPAAINVVVIGNADSSFLERIYRSPDFSFSQFTLEQIDYNRLSQADLIILREPREIPISLSSTLQDMARDNVFISIIPSEEINIQSYNSLLLGLELPGFQEKLQQERLISEIAYDHPLFREVFEERVANFQYPKVQSYYKTSSRGETVLGFENGDAFLLRKGNIFLFTAALNKENSNFQNAPLIVPTFYNFGNLALTPSPLYYVLGEPQEVDVDISLEKDKILNLSSPGFSFIPLQQSFPNKVVISLEEEPGIPGHYEIRRDSSSLKNISFNVNRKESLMQYLDPDSFEGAETASSIPSAFRIVESQTEIDSLWKWFVIFALFFLLTEMLILKFIK